MKKLIDKNKIGSFGGNMEAIEFYWHNYQVLISDCFGSPPEDGGRWSFSVYKKDSFGDFSETPCYRAGDLMDFNVKQAENLIRGVLMGLRNTRKVTLYCHFCRRKEKITKKEAERMERELLVARCPDCFNNMGLTDAEGCIDKEAV